MSISALLADEPLCYIVKLVDPGAVDAAGVPLDPIQLVRPIVGRLSVNSGRQKEMWRAIGVEADYLFTTMDPGLTNGTLLQSFDGRIFRVTGTNAPEYPKGNITEQTYENPMVEVKTT